MVLTYEPAHDKIIKMYASDLSSLCAHSVPKDLSFLHADSEDSDQIWRMPKLIGVFTGRMCHFVGFVLRWLIYTCIIYMYTMLSYRTNRQINKALTL